MKANHNGFGYDVTGEYTVSYGSKILKWKQITTNLPSLITGCLLFPMVQRY